MTTRTFALGLIFLITAACSGAMPPSETTPTSEPVTAPPTSVGSPAPSATTTPAATMAPAGPSVSHAASHSTMDTVDIAIEDFKFVPATLVVAAGTTVRWRNRDGEPHTVRSDDGSIASPLIVDEPFEWTADADAGATITYACGIHPAMRGSIEIR